MRGRLGGRRGHLPRVLPAPGGAALRRLWKHYLVDLPVAEVAATLGIAEGTVKSRLSRSRDRLAPLLAEEEREDA